MKRVHRTFPAARERIAFWLSAMFLSGLTPHVHAEVININLNPPLPAWGDVSGRGFDITTDSTRVVYMADQESDFVLEIYSVPITGGPTVKLNSPLVTGGSVVAFELTPDSSQVVYRAEQDSDNVTELYSAPITGGTVAKLSAPLATGGDVVHFKISPDSSFVVYLIDQDSDDYGDELYSVPIAGGAVANLNVPIPEAGSIIEYEITPDASRVVYRAYDDIHSNSGKGELFSVPIEGGASTKLNGPLPSYGDVWFGWGISPDSSRVVFRADVDVDNRVELYVVPIGGGSAAKLSSLYVTDVLSMAFSPDSSRVVYKAGYDSFGTYYEQVLYSVPAAGGTVTKLNDAFLTNGVDAYEISPDSSHVVFRGFVGSATNRELYTVPITGGSPIKLHDELGSDGYVDLFAISSDSSRVAYSANIQNIGHTELFSVPIGGGPVTKLDAPYETFDTGGIRSFSISSDAKRVVYHESRTLGVSSFHNLYSVPITGGTSTQLHGPFIHPFNVDYSDISGFKISSDSSFVVYTADQEVDEQLELYTSYIAAPITSGVVWQLF